jgi:hypothetical protein
MHRIIGAACLLLVCSTAQSVGAVECGLSALPSAAQRALVQAFSGWDVVTLSNLSAGDQPVWLENYGDKCPGVIQGNFTGSKAPSFVVLLIRRDKRKLLETLVLLSPIGRGYKLHTLDEPGETAVPDVLLKAPPGRYNDPEGTHSVRIIYDGILSVKLEAAATLYYKGANGFAHLTISE